jgi:hypothetical protein
VGWLVLPWTPHDVPLQVHLTPVLPAGLLLGLQVLVQLSRR